MGGEGGNSPFVLVCQYRDDCNNRDYDEEENDETRVDDKRQTHQPPRPCDDTRQFENEKDNEENDTQTA